MSGTSPSLSQRRIIMEVISSTGSNRDVHRIVSIQELRAGSLTSKRRLTKGDIDPRPHTLLQLWQNTDVTNSNMSGSRTIRTDANLYADSLYHYTTALPLLAHSFSRSARVEECFLECLTHFSFSPYWLSKRKIIPTTNLRRHVGAIHNRADLMYNSQKKHHQRKRSVISPEMKKILDEKHLQAIVIDSRAFNDFSRPGIRSFFSTALPGYKPLHRTTVRRRLRDKYIEHRRAVRTVFTQVSDIALTADTWKSVRHRHFISVTAHFFDKKFKLISLTLGFRVIDGRHGAARLARFINKEATFFKIREKIRSIITDNAKNMC